MVYKKEQNKNIISGYLYIIGAIGFVALMLYLITDANIEPYNRMMVEKVVVVMIGIACIYTGIRQIIDYKTVLEGVPKPMLDELRSQLDLFKSLDIPVTEITHCINKDKEKYFEHNPVIIYSDDIMEALEKYRAHKVNDKEFLIWCNLTSFSSCFHFNPERIDEIGSVMADIKRKLEVHETLTENQIDAYEEALSNHTEF